MVRFLSPYIRSSFGNLFRFYDTGERDLLARESGEGKVQHLHEGGKLLLPDRKRRVDVARFDLTAREDEDQNEGMLRKIRRFKAADGVLVGAQIHGQF